MTPDAVTLELLSAAAEELSAKTGMNLQKCKVIVWGVFRRLSDRDLAEQLLSWCYGPRWRSDTSAIAQADAPKWIAAARCSGVRLPVWEGRVAA